MASLHSIFFVFFIHLVTLLLILPLVFIAESPSCRNAPVPVVRAAAIISDADDLAPSLSRANHLPFSSRGEPLELTQPSILTLPC